MLCSQRDETLFYNITYVCPFIRSTLFQTCDQLKSASRLDLNQGYPGGSNAPFEHPFGFSYVKVPANSASLVGGFTISFATCNLNTLII